MKSVRFCFGRFFVKVSRVNRSLSHFHWVSNILCSITLLLKIAHVFHWFHYNLANIGQHCKVIEGD